MTGLTKFALTIEIIGTATVGIGIGIEIGYGADLGFLVITGGSFVVAIGALLWTKVLRK